MYCISFPQNTDLRTFCFVGYADLYKLQKPWHGSAIRRLRLPQYVSELREIYVLPSPHNGQNHDSNIRSSQYFQYSSNCTDCVLSKKGEKSKVKGIISSLVEKITYAVIINCTKAK